MPTFCQNTPSRIAVSPMIEPTERSMPPVMMMKVMGSATSATSVISRPWLSRLPTVMKWFAVTDRMSERDASAISEHQLLAHMKTDPRGVVGRAHHRLRACRPAATDRRAR